MRKPLFAVVIVLCGVAWMALSGCGTPSSAPLIPVASPDDALGSQVYDRLANDEVVQGHNISVSVRDGVVSLNGLPQDPGRRARAISLARGTPGVKDVTVTAGP